MADKDYSPEFFDKFAHELNDGGELKDVYEKLFSQPDYHKECKVYLVSLLNSPVSSRRYNAADFLDDPYYYNDKEVGLALYNALKKEKSQTVRSLMVGVVSEYIKKFTDLKTEVEND